MLQWLLNYLLRRISRQKAYFNACIEQCKMQDRHSDAQKIEKEIAQQEQRLLDLQSAYNSGQIGMLRAFWQGWSAWNELSNFEESLKPWWRQIGETLVFYGTLLFVLRHFIFGLYCVPTGSAEPNLLVGDRLLGLKYPYIFGEIKRGDLVIFDAPNFVYDQLNPINRLYQKYIGYPIPILGPVLGLTAGPEAWTKRVIALEGDTVEGRINAEGKTEIYVNGQLLDEPYLNPYPLITVRDGSGFFAPELGMPNFLSWHSEMINYTYDPNKSYADQPFYKLDDREVIYNQFTGKPFIKLPRTPGHNDKFPTRRVPKGKLWVMGDNRKNSDDCRSWGFLDKSLVVGRASRILFSIDSKESFWFFALLKNPIKFFTKQVRWARIFRSVHPFSEIPKN